jgi:hypothetical protein
VAASCYNGSVSVSSVGGLSVNLPDPGFYSSGNLPAGLDPASSATTTSASTGSTASSAAKAIQAEYNLLNQQDTAELLYASFLTPEQGIINANAVLQQAANIQDQQLAAAQAARLAQSDAEVTGSTPASGATPAGDVSNLPSASSLISQSDAAAQAALAAFAKAPAGSSILDFQA